MPITPFGALAVRPDPGGGVDEGGEEEMGYGGGIPAFVPLVESVTQGPSTAPSTLGLLPTSKGKSKGQAPPVPPRAIAKQPLSLPEPDPVLSVRGVAGRGFTHQQWVIWHNKSLKDSFASAVAAKDLEIASLRRSKEEYFEFTSNAQVCEELNKALEGALKTSGCKVGDASS